MALTERKTHLVSVVSQLNTLTERKTHPISVRYQHDVTKTKTPPWLGALAHLEPVMGIEPITTGLQGRCSTIEPHWRGMPIVPPSRRSSLPWREKTWSQLATACKHATGPAASRASRAPQDSAGPPASCANGSAPRAQPRRRVPRSRCRSPEAGSICSSPARRPP